MKKNGNLKFRAIISMILLITGTVSIFIGQYLFGIIILFGSMIFMSALYTSFKNIENEKNTSK